MREPPSFTSTCVFNFYGLHVNMPEQEKIFKSVVAVSLQNFLHAACQ